MVCEMVLERLSEIDVLDENDFVGDADEVSLNDPLENVRVDDTVNDLVIDTECETLRVKLVELESEDEKVSEWLVVWLIEGDDDSENVKESEWDGVWEFVDVVVEEMEIDERVEVYECVGLNENE